MGTGGMGTGGMGTGGMGTGGMGTGGMGTGGMGTGGMGTGGMGTGGMGTGGMGTGGMGTGGMSAQCMSPGDCPGQDTECQTRTCNGGVCGVSYAAAGTVVASQTAGDCKKNECDGAGSTVAVNDDTDLPVDNKTCTNDVCTSGVPSNPPVAWGTACNQGGTICDGNGTCINPTITVARVGDGAAALSNASTAVFLETRTLTGTLVGQPLALPIAAAGNNQPITVSGTATSEGALSLSANGKYVLMAGYASAPGVGSVTGTTSSAVNRVVARIDAAGNIDTSTRFDAAFNGNNVRSAASSDGTIIWAAGNGNAGSGGIWTTTLGTTGGTQIVTAPANVRVVNLFSGQLYGSSSSGTFVNVFSIGSGLPTMAGQTATSLPGMPTASGPSPYGFALLDLDQAVPGPDTLYVADDRVPASGGGIQKWKLAGGTWTLATTFNNGLTAGVAAVRGLAALALGTDVILVATTGDSPTKLVSFTDNGMANPAVTVLATAAANTALRGVALSPH
jgi:hypothetical protein